MAAEDEPTDSTNGHAGPTDEPAVHVPIDAREHEPPHLRPFGCHPDVPIVRRIGDRDLFLGNCFAADPERCDREFDAVLTVAEERQPGSTHFRPLVDSSEARWERLRPAVDTARRLHRTDGDLLVHCKAGISRSTTVIAATIASEEDRNLSEAYDVVREARPYAVAHPQLRKLAAYYVAGCGDREP